MLQWYGRVAISHVALFAGLMYSSTIIAENWTNRVSISGFASGVAQVTDDEVFFNGDGDNEGGINEDISYQRTRVGLNIRALISDRITVASQFLASREDENYSVIIDWGFISYSLSEDMTIRAGKVKFPAGIVNEYIDVGIAYPWIAPPVLFYTERISGPQAVREAYTGASGLWSHSSGDWTYGADLFGGEVALEGMTVRKLTGLTLNVDWNEMVTAKISTFKGEMANDAMAMMDGRDHSVILLGLKADWNDILAYAEWADVDMDDYKAGESEVWYVTLGYQFNRILPHITYQNLEKGLNTSNPQEQNMVTVGVKYNLNQRAALKMEVSQINTDEGDGLFEVRPGEQVDDSVNMFGLGIDVMF